MRIWAFDPGAVATGVAFVEEDGWYADQFPDPILAWDQLIEYGGKHDLVLVEDYRTSAQLTKEAKATIEIVGFLKYNAEYGWGWGANSAIMRVEQHRLSGQREAAELMGGTIEELRRDPNRKDAFSALSHCCVYRRGVR
jgi:hypothetical protein